VSSVSKKNIALFVLPFMLIFSTFTIMPVLVSVFFSFTNFNMVQMPQFVGLANYMRLFVNDELFLTALQNTIFFAMITGPIGYILCFTFAWFINQLTPKLRSFLTLLFYAPSIVGGLIVWQLLFSDDAHGLLNAWLANIGL